MKDKSTKEKVRHYPLRVPESMAAWLAEYADDCGRSINKQMIEFIKRAQKEEQEANHA